MFLLRSAHTSITELGSMPQLRPNSRRRRAFCCFLRDWSDRAWLGFPVPVGASIVFTDEAPRPDSRSQSSQTWLSHRYRNYRHITHRRPAPILTCPGMATVPVGPSPKVAEDRVMASALACWAGQWESQPANIVNVALTLGNLQGVLDQSGTVINSVHAWSTPEAGRRPRW